MRSHTVAALCVLVSSGAWVHAQAVPPASPQAPAARQPAAATSAQRQQIQQELRSLEQRRAARYPGDLAPEQIERRIAELRQQLEQLGPPPASGAAGRGFGAGRGGPITPPADATPEQLRQLIEQQNQQIVRLEAAQPARTAPPPPCVPVNPDATSEARDLLKRICDIAGKGILTGQHNFPNERNADSEAINAATGKYPAIWGSDFGFTNLEDKDAITHRNLMIEEAKRQYANGSIIYLCWHMLRPTEDEPGAPGASWGGSVQARLADEQWLELITSDSPLHQRWEKYMDTAAGYLKQLQDAHIPVLWRPMHENNGGFFWWGGRPGPYGTAQLYREVYNRMVNVHHLNNLLWVWNQNGPAPGGEFYSFYPGAKYADIVSYDNYGALDERYYQEIQAIANGKPIGLGEVGTPPPPEVLMAQPNWTFYMTWGGMTGAGRGSAAGAQPAVPVAVPENATPEQLREIIRQLQPQSEGRGGRGAVAYRIPEGAGVEMLRRIIQRLQPGSGNVLKAIYNDPYYIKRGDPMPQ
jgi:mannan endo-1,4-beta-mannosidase